VFFHRKRGDSAAVCPYV